MAQPWRSEEDLLARTDGADEDLTREIVGLNGIVLGMVIGLMAALFMFVATNWLVIRGGEPLGPHLGLVGQFFYGYSVSFIGSLVGAVYGFAFGFLVGWSTSRLYNLIVASMDR